MMPVVAERESTVLQIYHGYRRWCGTAENRHFLAHTRGLSWSWALLWALQQPVLSGTSGHAQGKQIFPYFNHERLIVSIMAGGGPAVAKARPAAFPSISSSRLYKMAHGPWP